MQLSVIGEYDRVFGTGQSIVPGGPIEFFVRGADGLYLDLSNSKLEIKIKITREDGNNIHNDDNVGPVNDILNALFMTMEMELAGVMVTDPNTKYPYRAIVENLINYNNLIANTRLVAEGWKKDTVFHSEVTDPTGDNIGLRERAAWFTESRVVTLIGRPHLDLFHQDKLIPSNIDLKLKLIPNNNGFLLKTPAPTDDHPQLNFKVQIMSARLFVRTKEISASLILAQEKVLQNTNYSIPFNKIVTKTITVPNGTSQIEFDNIYQGKLPDLIILGMVSDADMSGGYQRNPFNFQHFGANYLCMQANGEQIPRLAYQPDFANRDYIRSYFGVLEALGFDIGPNCWDLTPEEWANGYSLFSFKITHGPIGTVCTPPRVGSIRLEIKFGRATQGNITIVLLSQNSAEIQIDKYKNILPIN